MVQSHPARPVSRRRSIGIPLASGARMPAGDYERFLALHATLGYTEAEHARIVAMGGEAWLDEQLHPETIDDSAADALLAAYPSIHMSGPALWTTYGATGQSNVVGTHLRRAAIVRAVHSKRQLLERLVEHWNDALNVPQENGRSLLYRTLYDQDIRANALATFESLLMASGKSAAMLEYLNGNTNVAGAPNENYSREVMELHTLGAGVLYTEVDVREAARAFTGWSNRGAGASFGSFVFRAQDHDTGPKSMPGIGVTIPVNGGVSEGELVLRTLAGLPETIERISRRLLAWFVTYAPPQAAVERVERAWVRTGGDLRAVLGEVLSRHTVALCAPWSLPKHKRPFHLAIGLVRQLNPTDTNGYRGVLDHLVRMGQAPFGWLPPNGYPDAEGAWGASVLPRWQFADDLVQNRVSGANVGAASLLALYAGVGPANVAQRLSDAMTGGTLDPADVAAVQGYVNGAPAFGSGVLRDAIGLVASSPSYQRY